MDIEKLISQAATSLKNAGVENARADARLLMRHTLGLSLEELLLQSTRELCKEQEEAFGRLLALRLARKPISQIIGMREFWGMQFTVTPDTLDPRPDSETIIEALLHHMPQRAKPYRMLDLGTGTGCLLLSALSEYPSSTGLGVDISREALAVAGGNAEALGLKNRAKFENSDWNTGIKGVWDVVISNPPYIPTGDIPGLEPEVAKFEPITALDGGSDGLICYRAITRSLPGLLASSGIALLEVGQGQAPDVADLARAQGLRVVQLANDLAGIQRVVVISK